MEGLPGRPLRPDLQIYDATSKTAYICDLSIAFEAQKTNDPAAGNMRVRSTEKLVKYQSAKDFLETMGWRVQVSALVYGSLGSVLPSNGPPTEQLRLTKKNANQLNRRISVACVQASYKIWRMHSGALNPGDTSRNARPPVSPTAGSNSTGTRTSDPTTRPAGTPTSVSSTSRTSTSTRQPRRASTRWGPPCSQTHTNPVPLRRTSTR